MNYRSWKHSLGFAFLFLIGLYGSAFAAPHVVRTTPADGASEVDPATSQIVVQFDVPMKTDTYSLVQSPGGELPELVGDQSIAFKDKKTLTIQVRLAPGKSYAVGLNSAKRQGFRSADGKPLAPTIIRFRTAAGSPASGKGEWGYREEEKIKPSLEEAGKDVPAPKIKKVSSAGGPGNEANIPPGWVLMDDPLFGTQVAVPPGWTPRVREDTALCVEPDEVQKAGAFFLPMLLKEKGKPDEVADGFDEMLRRSLPDLRTQTRDRPTGESVQRDLSVTMGDTRVNGTYRAVVSRSGMGFVMGYQAPAERLEELRPIFHQILSSYRFTGSKMRLKLFQSAAVELKIPPAWQVQTSEGNGTANQDIDWVVSCPQIPGARAFMFTPKYITSNWVTSPLDGAVDQMGLALWQNRGYQVGDFPSDPQALGAALSAVMPGLQITRQQSLDAVRNVLMQLYAPAIQGLQMANSNMNLYVLEFLGRRQAEGKELRSVITVAMTTTVTQTSMKGTMAIWSIQVRGYEAPAAQFASLAPLLDRVSGSFTYTLWWITEVQKANAQQAKALRDLWAHWNKVDKEIWDNRLQTRSAINEMMYDTIISGNYGYVNKETGTIEKIPAERVEGFKDEYGQVVSTEETLDKKIDPRWATRLREATVDAYMNYDRRAQVWP